MMSGLIIMVDEPQTVSATFERFCLVLSAIPKGRVCSYGYVAELAALGNARQTCRWLRQLPKDSTLPWHRVVNAQGQVAQFANRDTQLDRLRQEGIELTATGRIPKQYFI